MKRGRKPKFNMEDVKAIQQLYSNKENKKESFTTLARLFKTNANTIGKIINNKYIPRVG